MHLVIDFKGIVSVHEVLFGLLFDFMLCFDQVKQLCSFFFIFGRSYFLKNLFEKPDVSVLK